MHDCIAELSTAEVYEKKKNVYYPVKGGRVSTGAFLFVLFCVFVVCLFVCLKVGA